MIARTGEATLAFLSLAGHPLRWDLLCELARSDRQVRELTSLLGQPQNLVSYHLGKLRAGELVRMRRSSADRRDAYYSIDLARCGELLAATGAALHPGLRLTPAATTPGATAAATAAGAPGKPVRVLFTCTGNSARSQMAEAFAARLGATHLGAGAIVAVSAGSHPKPLNKSAVLAMREHGVDISGQQAKHLSVFGGQHFDYVITLCDRVREICPEFPGRPQTIHWSIPDPSAEGGEQAFRRTAAELRGRVEFLIRRIASEHG